MIFVQVTGIFIFLGLIGYMIVLIYVKWWYPVFTYDNIVNNKCVDLADPTNPNPICTNNSPSIINLVIGDIMGLTGLATPNDPNLLWFSSQ